MTAAPEVLVRIDDRVRLMSAVLAVTQATNAAHARRPHSAHAHARATRKHLAPHQSHAAVFALQGLIEQHAPLESVFGYALRLRTPDFIMENAPRWAPPRWDSLLADFYHQAELAQWWSHEQHAWEKSVAEANRMLHRSELYSFLEPYVGTAPYAFVFLPNISYPADQDVGIRVGSELTCIAPPRAAWGDSPPWPFDEDPGHIYRAAIGQYTRLLMRDYLAQHEDKVREAALIELPVSEEIRMQHPTWQEQFLALLASGVVAIYLEDRVSPAEAKAYILMESKVYGMAMLPGVVSVLRRYMDDRRAGKYPDFAHFLPVFPKQLRVAKRIYSL
jgi:hypothetical protein